MRHLTHHGSHRSGFTIFFSVLVASLALAVGLAIYDIVVRELDLSQVASQSQYAIYASDSGVECALYWDFKYGTLAPSDFDGSAFATSTAGGGGGSGAGIACNTQDIFAANPVTGFTPTVVSDAISATTTFDLSMATAAEIAAGTALTKPCARVVVSKLTSGSALSTKVVSRGYNSCSASAKVRLERALQVTY